MPDGVREGVTAFTDLVDLVRRSEKEVGNLSSQVRGFVVDAQLGSSVAVLSSARHPTKTDPQITLTGLDEEYTKLLIQAGEAGKPISVQGNVQHTQDIGCTMAVTALRYDGRTIGHFEDFGVRP